MVRAEGVEPPRLATLEPKSSASTSSATRADKERRYSKDRRRGNRLRLSRVCGGERNDHDSADAARNSAAARTAATLSARTAYTGTAGNACSIAGRGRADTRHDTVAYPRVTDRLGAANPGVVCHYLEVRKRVSVIVRTRRVEEDKV